jgi:hypothetical protein
MSDEASYDEAFYEAIPDEAAYDAFMGAVKAGDLQEIKGLHQYVFSKRMREPPKEAILVYKAALAGHLECVKYLHENGCPWDERTCTEAAQGGQLECLRYMHENGCPWDEDTCHAAAEFGNLECLKYALENGCPCDDETCDAAAFRGHLECFKYLHENGATWDKDTITAAAAGGHLECLKYLHENGCPWYVWTCAAAAEGHLECLKYAHQNGCPWDERVCAAAARGGHLECLKYAHENGCPLNIDEILHDLPAYGMDRSGEWFGLPPTRYTEEHASIEAYVKTCSKSPIKCPFESAMAVLDEAKNALKDGDYKTIADALMLAHRAKRQRR